MLSLFAPTARSRNRLPSSGVLFAGLLLTSLLLPGNSATATAAELSADETAGLKVYKKANCMGCHKWHGKGGGGYGGRALSLRATSLDQTTLTMVVRCGLPSTGMPYHGRNAYKTPDDASCYGQPASAFGKNVPPRARSLLSERQIDAVVHYVLQRVKGHGEPNHEECELFWGKNKRQCDVYTK